MKTLWIAGALVIVSLSCRREETATLDQTRSGELKSSGTPSQIAAESVPEDEDAKPTKTKERPPNTKKKIAEAEPVADRPGFVKSPFSGTIIDVRGIPAGTLVADPSFAATDKKHFRVPEMPEDAEEELRKQNAPVAGVVPGKQEFIFSPYDNKIIDVRDIPPGTVIQDPTAPEGEKRYIKIPGDPPPETNSIDDP